MDVLNLGSELIRGVTSHGDEDSSVLFSILFSVLCSALSSFISSAISSDHAGPAVINAKHKEAAIFFTAFVFINLNTLLITSLVYSPNRDPAIAGSYNDTKDWLLKEIKPPISGTIANN